MTNSRKGARFEAELARWLQENGFPRAERRAKRGVDDRGDIAGIPGVVIEAKNQKRLDFPGWLAEAEVEAERDNADHGIVIARRRNHWIGRSYFLLDLVNGTTLLRRAGYGEPL